SALLGTRHRYRGVDAVPGEGADPAAVRRPVHGKHGLDPGTGEVRLPVGRHRLVRRRRARAARARRTGRPGSVDGVPKPFLAGTERLIVRACLGEGERTVGSRAVLPDAHRADLVLAACGKRAVTAARTGVPA